MNRKESLFVAVLVLVMVVFGGVLAGWWTPEESYAGGPIYCKTAIDSQTIAAYGAYTSAEYPMDKLDGYFSAQVKVGGGSGTGKLCYQVASTHNNTAPAAADWATPTGLGPQGAGTIFSSIAAADGWKMTMCELPLASWVRFVVRETAGAASITDVTMRFCRQ